MSYSPLSRVTA
jgi:hypothetical protein